MATEAERIDHIFNYMEYDALNDRETELVESFHEQWIDKERLSERQKEVLESIFKEAASRA